MRVRPCPARLVELALRALAPALLAALASGCLYFSRSPIRPVPALAFYADAETRARCLVVFLPGLMDGPETIRDRALPSVVRASGAPCDSVAVDATYRYYFGAAIDEVIHDDILVPATVRGYEEIWLVGISLGGLGAALTARAHPALVDGVILLSPYLGLEEIVRDIAAAGGLSAWEPPESARAGVPRDADFTLFVWAWLHGLVTDPASMPELYVGWVEGERLAPTSELLAAALPASHSFSVEGSHAWASWNAIFAELATRAPLGRLPSSE